MALEQMPPEMVDMILLEIPSSQDLYSLIRASPKCSSVFHQKPQSYVTTALRNSIHPVALPHALAVLSTPIRSHQLRGRRHVFAVMNFLDLYTEGHQFEFPRDRSSLYALSRLSIKVTWFSNDYAGQILQIFRVQDNSARGSRPEADITPATSTTPEYKRPREHMESTSSCLHEGTDQPHPSNRGSQTDMALSDSELARFQRAFFRYEVYCRSFSLNEEPHELIYPLISYLDSSNQFDAFLAHLKPWEVEEMSCVHEYLSTLLYSLLKDLGESLVEEVLNAKGVQYPPNWARSSSKMRHEFMKAVRLKHDGSYVYARRNLDHPFINPSSSHVNDSFAPYLPHLKGKAEADNYNHEGDDMEHFDCFNLPGLKMLTRDYVEATIAHLSYLASHGLGFIFNLIKANDQERREMILSDAPIDRQFLPNALNHAPLRGMAMPSSASPQTLANDPLECNLAYQLLKKPREDIYLSIFITSVVFPRHRALGWVFWDANRLHVLEKTRVNIDLDVHTMYDIYYDKSVQERVLGFRLPRKEKERIATMFTPTVHLQQKVLDALKKDWLVEKTEGEQDPCILAMSSWVLVSQAMEERRKRLGYSTGEQSAEEESTEEQPAEGKSTGGQPTGGQSTGGQPSVEPTAGGQTTGEQSVGENPTGEEPVGGEAAREEPTEGKPAGKEHTGEEPTGEQT